MGNTFRHCPSHMLLNQSPVVVVLGCTGTGKSKLAIEIAKKFNGEIISADSMQVYKGLDIITNKVTTEEQQQAVHYCINDIDPLSRYTVVDFHNQAMPILNKIAESKKLPIIVGGTNYYIESLLWDALIFPKFTSQSKLLFDTDRNDLSSLKVDFTDCKASDLLKFDITADSFRKVPSSVLHECLEQIDPAMADALHPSDRRKVIRSLQVYQQHGKRHSDMLKDQHSQDSGSIIGGPLRLKKSILLWLTCDKDVLDKRLDDRVDDMLEKGLMEELSDFHKSYNADRVENGKSYTEGIFQSIGFKEFHDYLILPEQEKNSDKGKKCFAQGVEDMKLATRQYSRKQVKWIVNRFLRKSIRELPAVYGLDATDLDRWEENALEPAIQIVESIIKGEIPKQEPMPLVDTERDIPETHHCDTCDRIFVGRKIWEGHLKSNRHHKRKASLKKSEERKTKMKKSIE